MRVALLATFLLVSCTAPQPMNAPDPSIPKMDVSMHELGASGRGWSGIVVAPRLVLTVAHSGMLAADVVVVDFHTTYVDQVIGTPDAGYVDLLGEVSSDWLLVATAEPVEATPASIALGATPTVGTKVVLLGHVRDRDGPLDAPSARRGVDGTVVDPPGLVPAAANCIYVATSSVDGHGLSGGPVLALDGPNAGMVVGMTSEAWASAIGLPGTVFMVRTIEPAMISRNVDGRRFHVLGKRSAARESEGAPAAAAEPR